jgi:hypothetical protein
VKARHVREWTVTLLGIDRETDIGISRFEQLIADLKRPKLFCAWPGQIIVPDTSALIESVYIDQFEWDTLDGGTPGQDGWNQNSRARMGTRRIPRGFGGCPYQAMAVQFAVGCGCGGRHRKLQLQGLSRPQP